ncbi:J domain-containing protein [Candidatus Woesearchaeota archaeon]|jgi:curved DNA-binding protein CbpA|nr:J domain-containing protein [Candidatus Woesearchaeota archaeon]MBT5272130.1 J domain-containing protein [Candidatus Woesearchaeota archaeon]MBT6040933.1 J domain-containing protein [Candidatus Woesearchaeota archaeon]MBT6336267.1 J domain-containing protein [Candidatus Woesearchaeota archaeon]MBT7927250.1 J domain-containing protein [Candidatus Woesearchaeota archaeon]
MGEFSIDDFLDIDLVTDRALAYRILGVESGTDKDALKKAYRGLASKYHPDKVQQEEPELLEKHEKFFKLLSEAYSFLTDPKHKNGVTTAAPTPPPANFRDRFAAKAKERAAEVKAEQGEERKRWAKDPYGRGKVTPADSTTSEASKIIMDADSEGRSLTLDDLLQIVKSKTKKSKSYNTFYDKITGDYVDAQGLIELNWGDPLFGAEYEKAIQLIIGTDQSKSSKRIENKIAKISQMDFKKERFIQALLYAENILFDHPTLAFPFHSLEVAEEMAVAKSLEQMLLAGTVAATVLRDHALKWPGLFSMEEASNYSDSFLELYSALLPHCLRQPLSSFLSKDVIDRFYNDAGRLSDDLKTSDPKNAAYNPAFIGNRVRDLVDIEIRRRYSSIDFKSDDVWWELTVNLLSKVIRSVEKFTKDPKAAFVTAPLTAGIMANVISGEEDLHYVGEVLDRVYGTIRFKPEKTPNINSLSSKINKVFSTLDRIKETQGYSNENISQILYFGRLIQSYKSTRFYIKTPQRFAEFTNIIADTIPIENMNEARGFLEALSVGASEYQMSNITGIFTEWKDVLQNAFPFYCGIKQDQDKLELFNKAMTAFSAFKDFVDDNSSSRKWYEWIEVPISVAAYGGQKVVEEALKCEDPLEAVSEFQTFISSYARSKYFPARKKKDIIFLGSTPKQEEAYNYLLSIQNKKRTYGVKFKREELDKFIDIYFSKDHSK